MKKLFLLCILLWPIFSCTTIRLPIKYAKDFEKPLKAKKYKGVQIENQNIHQLPETFNQYNYPNILVISLQQNRLDSLHEEFYFSNLQLLNLDQNDFHSFPKQILANKSLIALSLSGNKLEDLPRGLLGLNNLRRLWLKDNHFREFPTVLCELKELNLLSLSGNKIDSIPSCIGELKELQAIFLGDMGLERVPDFVMYLDQLTGLDLSFNNISSFPSDLLAHLPRLKRLDLRANPLKKEEIEEIKKKLTADCKFLY